MPYVDAGKAHDEGDLETGTRVCRQCHERKPITEFHWVNGKRHRSRWCKRCYHERSMVRRAERPEQYALSNRRQHLWRVYRMSLEDYDRLLAKQDGCCAICAASLDGGRTHVDHDHRSGVVRGILCMACNIGLGHFRDNLNFVTQALAYLSRHALGEEEGQNGDE